MFCYRRKKYCIFLCFLLIATSLNDDKKDDPRKTKGYINIITRAEVPVVHEDVIDEAVEKADKEPKIQLKRPAIAAKLENHADFGEIDGINEASMELIKKEMKDLSEKNKGALKIVHRFHIPPVEYNVELKDFILPVGMILAGTVASQSKYRDFIPIDRPEGSAEVTHVDDVLQYSLIPALFVLDALDKEKHHPIDQFFLMSISSGLTALQVRKLKSYLKKERPDGGNNSFPSGHTALAFIGAQMIYKEFKDSNPLIAYSGYATASTVGILRMVNNRHWFCDIVAGAGIAMLSTELAYWIYFPVRNFIADEMNLLLDNYFIVTPVFNTDHVGLQVNLYF